MKYKSFPRLILVEMNHNGGIKTMSKANGSYQKAGASKNQCLLSAQDFLIIKCSCYYS